MKKLIRFIRENGVKLLAIIVIAALLGAFVIPFMVGIARVMWDVAINNPTALM